MPDMGRAAVFVGKGQPFALREYPLVDPGPEDTIVRVRRTNVCGTDLHVWRGDTDLAAVGLTYAMILGHEMVGEVYRMGAKVRGDAMGQTLAPGDRVVFTYYVPCDRCVACLRGDVHMCMQSLATPIRPCDVAPHFVGGFADYYYVKGRQRLFKVPDTLSDAVVAGANCALSQVLHGLDVARLRLGETVVVQGAGGLGLFACAVARAAGAQTVIAIDGNAHRLELARAFGADEVIDLNAYPEARARVERVQSLTGNWGADIVVEVVGFPDVVNEGIRMLGRGGRYLELGNVNAKHTYKADPSLLVGFNRSILGVSLYPPLTLKRAVDFLDRTRERFPYERLASASFSLARIDEAFVQADAFAKNPAQLGRAGIVPALA